MDVKWTRTNALPAGLFCAIIALALFFRSYDFNIKKTPGPGSFRAAAERFVADQIRGQIASALSGSGLTGADLKREVDRRFEEVLKTDRAQFQAAVAHVLEEAPSGSRGRYARHYLLEADPYHYMDQTQEILRTGTVSRRIENNKYYDPLRVVPKGFWTPINLHPFLGALFYRILSVFRKIDLMEALGFVPLMLIPAIAATSFFMLRACGLGWTATALGTLTLLQAPVFLQRSSYGWYDTDPYNMLFPTFVLGCFFSALDASTRKKALAWALAGGAATGLYSLFWIGWPFLFFLTAGSAAGICVLGLWKRSFRNSKAWLFGAVYTGSAVAAAILCSTPAGFIEFIARGAKFIGQFSSTHQDAWPNIFLTVGETNSLTLKRLIFLTGNYATFAVMLLGGVAAEGFWAWHRTNKGGFLKWMTVVMAALPLLFLSLRTERFSLLFVLPTALLTAFGVQAFLDFAGSRIRGHLASLPGRVVVFALPVIVLLPLQLIFSHALALKSEPIMDDAWYESMMKLKKDTPEDSVVYNWWPPGYFLTALAERRIVADGGTQHLPECYWSARFFMSTDIREALGILRMHLHVGNGAEEFMEAAGMKTWEAMELLNQVLPLEKAEAEPVLRAKLSGEKADGLVEMLYPDPRTLPPVYIYVYNEMIEKNLAMSILARWNFRRAAERQKEPHSLRLPGMGKNAKRDSLLDILSLSDGVLKYRPEAKLLKRDGNVLYFANGLVVNLETRESRVVIPGEKVDGQPASLFLIRDGVLEETPNKQDLLDVSALVYREGDSYGSVLADRRLIHSMLFRLYYLRGEGLGPFKLFFEADDKGTGNIIRIFEKIRNDSPLPTPGGGHESS